MHDCPKCQIPLHGHESFCPVCGLKQVVKQEYRDSGFDQYRRAGNPLWLVVIAIIVGGVLFYAVQNSWVGALIKRGPVVEEKTVNPIDARAQLESIVIQNLATQSATGKFTYASGEKTVDRNCPDMVQLTIDTRLKQPEKRKEIVDPVKPLMEPAHISSITLNDSRSGATVTYTMTPSPDPDDDKKQSSGDGSANSQE